MTRSCLALAAASAVFGAAVAVAGLSLAGDLHRLPSTQQADAQVCSHVQQGPGGAAGDWRDPAVARIAYTSASQSLRDAYASASEAQMPFGASPDQASAVVAARQHLVDVCAAVGTAP